MRQHSDTPNDFKFVSKTLLAGGIAGCCAKTVIAPLDRVKILFQGSNPYFGNLAGTWTGVFRAAGRIIHFDGATALFRGHSATLARIFPYAAVQFMSYEQLKRVFNIRRSQDTPVRQLLAGSLAGVISVFATYPLDNIRAKIAFQVTDRRYTGLFDALSKTYQSAGFHGIYRGLMPTVVGIVPYAGVSFFTYETLKSLAQGLPSTSELRPWCIDSGQDPDTSERFTIPFRLFAGGLAGATGQTIAYPLDVIRRRMQLEEFHSSTPRYTSTLGAVRRIIKTAGVRNLYVGLSINYLKVAPAVGISFVTYETAKEYLGIS